METTKETKSLLKKYQALEKKSLALSTKHAQLQEKLLIQSEANQLKLDKLAAALSRKLSPARKQVEKLVAEQSHNTASLRAIRHEILARPDRQNVIEQII